MNSKAERVHGLWARVNSAGLHRCAPDWRLDPSRTSAWKDLDLWVLVSGRGHVRTPEGMFALSPGTCLLLRGGQNYEFFPALNHPFTHYWAHFDYVDERGRTLALSQLALPPVYRKIRSPGLLFQLLQRTVDELRKSGTPARLVDRWFNAALMEVIDEDSRFQTEPTIGKQAAWIEAVCAAIRNHPGHPHRVEQMAEEVGYDVAYFSRLFRKHVGISPKQFISRSRMEAARFLLRDSATSVGHIADALGYHDVHFFSRQFKAENGVSPTDFRRRPDGE